VSGVLYSRLERIAVLSAARTESDSRRTFLNGEAAEIPGPAWLTPLKMTDLHLVTKSPWRWLEVGALKTITIPEMHTYLFIDVPTAINYSQACMAKRFVHATEDITDIRAKLAMFMIS
jgi:hypothetical protein